MADYLASGKVRLVELYLKQGRETAEIRQFGDEKNAGQAGCLPHPIDREIDELVYQLYRLTAAEIRLVDAAFDVPHAKAA